MARRKNRPEAVQEKCLLSERLREIRVELYGERGGSEMARRLGLPVRTWYNYESGVTVPAEILLRFVELTSVEPSWLLHGRGPRFRTPPLASVGRRDMVRDLLRIALQRLEQGDDRSGVGSGLVRPSIRAVAPARAALSVSDPSNDVVLLRVEPSTSRSSDPAEFDTPHFVAARRDWIDTSEPVQCVRIDDDAMAPILCEGAYAAFTDVPPDLETLGGHLVVARIESGPVVRWFDPAGHGKFALLRAENPRTQPASIFVDFEGDPDRYRIRRVLWTTTPH